MYVYIYIYIYVCMYVCIYISYLLCIMYIYIITYTILYWDAGLKNLRTRTASGSPEMPHKILAKFLYFLISIDWAASQMRAGVGEEHRDEQCFKSDRHVTKKKWYGFQLFPDSVGHLPEKGSGNDAHLESLQSLATDISFILLWPVPQRPHPKLDSGEWIHDDSWSVLGPFFCGSKIIHGKLPWYMVASWWYYI